ETELEVLFPLACMRLCVSACMAAHQRRLEPDNEYLSVTEAPAWKTLARLADVHPRFAECVLRNACGLPVHPASATVINWLNNNPDRVGRVVEPDLRDENTLVIDLSVGSLELPSDDETDPAATIQNRVGQAGAQVGVGRYDEPRLCYLGDQYQSGDDLRGERRTIHIGVDLFLDAGSPVLCPLDGKIHSVHDNAADGDYGPTIILEHQFQDGQVRFFTLYGHLSRESLSNVAAGDAIQQGDRVGTLGDSDVNGGWPPHLHFQLILDMLGKHGDFPGVAAPSVRDVWLGICPDPNLILKIPGLRPASDGLGKQEILDARRRRLGRSLSVSYREPLKIVRGRGQYLYDEEGQAHLDAVNNVCHVGHCHPRVVAAARRQAGVLNTNTRYLHENLIRYAERLCATFPDPLNVCFLVNSGSEANDLALRLARTHSQATDVVVLEGAYHGNLSSLVDISPYKFDGPGGQGTPSHVHQVSMPDGYRGPFRHDDPDAGTKYAQHVRDAVQRIQEQGHRPAAFFCESLLGCGGQIVLPDGYLREAYRQVREAGGICVADEVQVGFGRVGERFWGFETQGVVPDVVTLGKPIGNGHPLGAVVTTAEIADSFANGMEYFNTYGGNPVSCAVGLAVLDVIETEELQAHAARVGNHLKSRLKQLAEKHAVIGEVRGLGLFLGVELVLDRETLAPAAEIASYAIERAKELGILLSTDGPLHNVLKIKPPLVFSEPDADRLVDALDHVLSEDSAQPFG
ncbi:MAG: aminotransferase class III-fold pyridoxal phosphate-dependent enzyme, partial [Planctomycetales bacterium]